MMMRALALGAVSILLQPAANSKALLAPVRTIALPGVEGRIDHLAFDAANGRLYVAALGNNTVEAIDFRSGRVATLRGFREPQGIAVASDVKEIAVANGEGTGIDLLDESGRVVKSARLGDDSDNVRYDAPAKRLYVGYGSGALAAIDPSDARVVGEVKLAGHPESFQLERSGPRVFVNVPTAGHIAVVDRAAMKVTATWPVTEARSNFPMALDEPDHLVFVGCRSPARALAYDTTTGKLVASADIVGDSDDLFYDAARRRLYVSGGEGYVDVLAHQGGGRLTRVARVATAPGARTSLFVAERSRLYVAVPHRGAQRAEIREFEAIQD